MVVHVKLVALKILPIHQNYKPFPLSIIFTPEGNAKPLEITIFPGTTSLHGKIVQNVLDTVKFAALRIEYATKIKLK